MMQKYGISLRKNERRGRPWPHLGGVIWDQQQSTVSACIESISKQMISVPTTSPPPSGREESRHEQSLRVVRSADARAANVQGLRRDLGKGHHGRTGRSASSDPPRQSDRDALVG